MVLTKVYCTRLITRQYIKQGNTEGSLWENFQNPIEASETLRKLLEDYLEDARILSQYLEDFGMSVTTHCINSESIRLIKLKKI